MIMNSSEEVASAESYQASLPFPIACISTGKSKKCVLFDVDLISWLRREYHILGVLIGSLPQAPSQNVFLGLPLVLMPEEVQLLVEKNLAFVVDDRAWHLTALQNGTAKANIKHFQAELARQGQQAAQAARKAKELRLEEVMKNLALSDDMKQRQRRTATDVEAGDSRMDEDSLFAGESVAKSSSEDNPHPNLDSYAITPTLSGSLRSDRKGSEVQRAQPSAYALFKMLHSKGYFLSPGLRFGCQYMAYPGDPLRYHSHFLVVSSDWDEPIDLIDIIGSGRLATGVKKSFLLGGISSPDSKADIPSTRAFSIEWAGM